MKKLNCINKVKVCGLWWKWATITLEWQFLDALNLAMKVYVS